MRRNWNQTLQGEATKSTTDTVLATKVKSSGVSEVTVLKVKEYILIARTTYGIISFGPCLCAEVFNPTVIRRVLDVFRNNFTP